MLPTDNMEAKTLVSAKAGGGTKQRQTWFQEGRPAWSDTATFRAATRHPSGVSRSQSQVKTGGSGAREEWLAEMEI